MHLLKMILKKQENIKLENSKMDISPQISINEVSSEANLSTAQSSASLISTNQIKNLHLNKKSSYITLIIMFTLNLINYSDRFTIAGKYFLIIFFKNYFM